MVTPASTSVGRHPGQRPLGPRLTVRAGSAMPLSSSPHPTRARVAQLGEQGYAGGSGRPSALGCGFDSRPGHLYDAVHQHRRHTADLTIRRRHRRIRRPHPIHRRPSLPHRRNLRPRITTRLQQHTLRPTLPIRRPRQRSRPRRLSRRLIPQTMVEIDLLPGDRTRQTRPQRRRHQHDPDHIPRDLHHVPPRSHPTITARKITATPTAAPAAPETKTAPAAHPART